MRILCFIIGGILGFISLSNTLYAAPYVDDVPIDPQLNEEVLFVNVGIYIPASLQVTFFRPDGLGPFPVVILNHGKNTSIPGENQRYRSVYAARYFISRGFAVVLPMMRGFAGSSGRSWLQNCDIEMTAQKQAIDIKDLILALPKTKIAKWLDLSQLLIVGQGMGGYNSIVSGSLDIPGLKGIVSFTNLPESNKCPDLSDVFFESIASIGLKSKVPNLWFYTDKNGSSTVPLIDWEALSQKYRENGGNVDIVQYHRNVGDNNNFLGQISMLSLWVPRLDGFLDQVQINNLKFSSNILPSLYPQESGYAAINDINALPIDDKSGYMAFLNKPKPRVFMIATNGSYVSTESGYDPLERAKTLCVQHQLHCQAYAVDDYVVWPMKTPLPPPSQYASIVDEKAVPYLDFIGQQGYLQFLLLPPPRVFVIAPDGAWFVSNNNFDDQASALEQCSVDHKDCQVYAVDDRVVWVKH
jgi:dienelactone hydrolase